MLEAEVGISGLAAIFFDMAAFFADGSLHLVCRSAASNLLSFGFIATPQFFLFPEGTQCLQLVGFS